MNLLHELDGHADVRPILDERFRLRQALDELSRGRPFEGRKQQLDQQVDNDDDAIHHHEEQYIAAAAS
jgi:hypothetical protein